MRPTLKKGLKAALASLTAILVLGTAILALLMVRPALLVNERTLALSARLARPFGIGLTWKSAAVEAEAPTFWRKAARLSLADVCLRMPSYGIDACFKTLQAAAEIDLQPGAVHLTKLGPVTALGGTVVAAPPPAAREAAPSPAFDWQHLPRPALLAGTELGAIDVELERWDVRTAAVTAHGKTRLAVKSAGDEAHVALQGSDLCLPAGPVHLEGCIDDLTLNAAFAVQDGFYRLLSLGPVAVQAKSLAVEIPPSSSASAPAPGTPAKTPEAVAAFLVGPPDDALIRLPPSLAGLSRGPVQATIGRWTFAGAGVTASGSLDFSAERTGDEIGAALSLGRFCAKAPPAGVDGCFAKLEVAARATLAGTALRLHTLGPVAATGGRLRFDRGAATAQSEPPAASAVSPARRFDPDAPFVPFWLINARLAPVSVVIDRAEITDGGKRFLGSLRLAGGSRGTGGRWDLQLRGRAAGASSLPLRTAEAHLTVASQDGAFTGPWSVSGKADGELTAGGTVAATGTARETSGQELRFDFKSRLARGAGRAEARFRGQAGPQGLAVNLTSAADHLVPGVDRVDLKACHVDLDWQKARTDPARLGLDCHVTVRPKRIKGEVPIRLPPSADFALRGELTAPLPPQGEDPVSGHVSVQLTPLKTDELAATAALDARLSGTIADPPRTLNLALDTRARVEVPEFAALVAALRGTRFAVPAPFSVLRGQVALEAAAHGDPLKERMTVPLKATTRLTSPGQVLNVDANGVATLAPGAPQPKVALDVMLSDVQLALPTIPLRSGAPQLLPDKRVTAKPPLPRGALPVDYEVTVRTPDGRPLRLLSNLAKAPVPLRIDTRFASSGPAKGDITVQEFPLNLFRRDARVDRFVLAFGAEKPTLDGKLSVTYTDYTIQILILGTLDAPVVKLFSDPPRTERELVAILLFGKEMDDLDDDQMQSADSMRAAAADGALSLASLYLLAATPVQSIGYDPQAKAFTAKIALGPGTSLNLGSDFEDYEKVGLRRRVTKDWSAETFVERRAETEEQSATALLEWSKRY